jgi:antitoxin YefM
MEAQMMVIKVTEARAKLYKLIDHVSSTHKPVLIAGKRGNAVLIAEEDWSAVQETLHLLSIPGMRKSIRKGLAEPVEECTEDIDW